jgi:hypothetical protein
MQATVEQEARGEGLHLHKQSECGPYPKPEFKRSDFQEDTYVRRLHAADQTFGAAG